MIRAISVQEHTSFPAVYVVSFEDGSERLATVNLAPGIKVYGEQLIVLEGKEYRIWNPYRSKLAGAISKGLKINPIRPGTKVLYLGVASGTTPSHVSDIIGPKGILYGVEFAPRVMREFIEKVANHRMNVIPLLADARFPSKYAHIVESVDVIYADIAQPFQSKYVADNADMFLKKGGWIMMAIKAMSIDVTKAPSETYKKEMEHLEQRGYKVQESLHLEPYDEAHAFIVAQKE